MAEWPTVIEVRPILADRGVSDKGTDNILEIMSNNAPGLDGSQSRDALKVCRYT